MRSATGAVLLVLLVLCAGCASPTETEDGGEAPANTTVSPTENEFGAHPNNPANATNGTEGAATVNPPGTEAGGNDTEDGAADGTETSDGTTTADGTSDGATAGTETDTIAFDVTITETNSTATNESSGG